jgi:hypothetical protein
VSQGRSKTAVRVGDDLREVLLTLSPTQFERLARDLKQLRDAGAASNTSAIVDAVNRSADMVRSVDQRRAA